MSFSSSGLFLRIFWSSLFCDFYFLDNVFLEHKKSYLIDFEKFDFFRFSAKIDHIVPGNRPFLHGSTQNKVILCFFNLFKKRKFLSFSTTCNSFTQISKKIWKKKISRILFLTPVITIIYDF